MAIIFGYTLFAFTLVTTSNGVPYIANEGRADHETAVARNSSNISFASCHNQLHERILASSYIFEGSTEARQPIHQLKSSDIDGVIRNVSSGDDTRVAHCIVGSARTLWHPHAYKSIQDNFISALGGSYNTFMYMKLADSKELFPVTKANQNRRPIYNAHLEELDNAIAYLDPTKVVIAPEKPVDVY